MNNPTLPANQKDLAAALGVTARTIREWRKRFGRGAMESPLTLLRALSTLERTPVDAARALRGMLGDQTEDLGVPRSVAGAEDDAGDAAGVANTIKRLELAERDAWKMFQQANDPLSRKLESDIWLKISGEWLKFDRGISKDRLQSGQLVELKDVRESIVVLSRAFFFALKTLAVAHVEHHGAGLDGIKTFLYNAATMALPALGDFAPEGDLGISSVNGSIRECFVESFRAEFRDMPEASRRRIALFEALLALVIAKTPEEKAECEARIREIAA